MSQKQTRKQTPARRRAEEALDQIAKSSSQPTKKVLDFLLSGSHDEPYQEPATNQNNSQPNPDQTQTNTRPAPNPGQPRPDPDQVGPPHKAKTFGASHKATTDAAPARDFNRRANSLEREALPAGVFPGASKKLYDALYLRTRGAIKPTRTIQATRRELMQWAGIKDVKTINAHVKRLTSFGLLTHLKSNGDHEGSVYEIFLPEEANPDQTQTKGIPNPSPKLDPDQDQKMVWVGSGKSIENKDTYEFPNTFIKTNYDDDEPFRTFTEIFKEANRDLTGAVPKAEETARWAEVARIIVAELKDAARKTSSVSSVPAFLAAHLKRRFAKSERMNKKGTEKAAELKTSAQAEARTTPVPNSRLTKIELSEQASIIAELMKSGYTIEQADSQFKGSFHEEDWTAIKDEASSLVAG